MSDTPRDCPHRYLARKCEICELMECERLLDAKEKECEELRKDAERYRWLRVHSTLPVEAWSTHSNPQSLDESLNEAIDAAMGEKP